MKRPVINAAALALTSLLWLGACSSGTSGGEATSAGADQASAADDAAADDASATVDLGTVVPGVLTVALATADPPSSFLDDNNNPDGYDVRIIELIAAKLGLEIEWKAAEYSVMIPNIANGTWDTGTQGALVTEERKLQVDFSNPVDFAQARLVSLTSAPVDSFAAAAGKKIGVFTDAHQAVAEKEIPDVQIIKFDSNATLLNSLRSGQIDAYVFGQNNALAQAAENDDVALSEPVTTGQVSIPLPKQNPALLDGFNQALDELAADGTLAALHAQYYEGVPIPADLAAAYDNFKS